MTTATTVEVPSARAGTEPDSLDVRRLREDFPILRQAVHGKPLVYLDNANTSQKPLDVLNALDRYYREYNANIHRATHLLSEKATRAYEDARARIARFINADSAHEIVYVRGCTEGINLVASSWGRQNLREGDEVIL